MFRLLLNGDIGALPQVLGVFGLDVSLFSPSSVVPLLVVLDVLQWTPFTFLICYAGLQSFPRELLEAAQVDGASALRILRSIVLPVISPVLFAAAFLRAVDAIRTFDLRVQAGLRRRRLRPRGGGVGARHAPRPAPGAGGRPAARAYRPRGALRWPHARSPAAAAHGGPPGWPP